MDLVLDLDQLESKPEAEDIELEFDIQSEEPLTLDKGGDDLDFSLDLDLELDETPTKDGVKTKTEEFEFDLDLDDDFSKPPPSKAPVKAEEKEIAATIFADDLNDTGNATIAMPDDTDMSPEPAVSSYVPQKPMADKSQPKFKPQKESSKV